MLSVLYGSLSINPVLVCSFLCGGHNSFGAGLCWNCIKVKLGKYIKIV